jgi:DNA-binding NarL/FixJ family response regulator
LSQIRIFIADSNELIREGVKAVLKRADDIRVVAEASESSELLKHFQKNSADVVIIDYSQPEFKVDDIRAILSESPAVKILALTEKCEKNAVTGALKAGLNGHILYCCDKNEITDAIRSVARGDKFYCGKVLDVLHGNSAASSCAPVTLSPREIEIISLIADGLSNKQIADKLFLSTHTVMTHRKNIMNKLGVNNTAGIVMYAVKENIINPNKYLFAQETVNRN